MPDRRPITSVARSAADLAFHSSHTDWLKPSSIGSPETAASTPRRMITPPDPMCDNTSEIVHFFGYDWLSSCSGVSALRQRGQAGSRRRRAPRVDRSLWSSGQSNCGSS